MEDIRSRLKQLRARQAAILAHLPPYLAAEYRKVVAEIDFVERQADAALRKRRKKAPANSEGLMLFDNLDAQPAPATDAERGVPLSQRRIVLVEYLRTTGGAKRPTILRETAIPAGSLAALLTRGGREGWLVRDKEGIWRESTSA